MTKTVRERIWGSKAEKLEAVLEDLDPDLAALIVDTVYEGIFARAGLDLKTRELLAITALLGSGGEAELRTHLHGP